MRGREALVVLVALVSLAAPASVQADLIGVDDEGHACVRRDGRDGYHRVQRRAEWQVLARRANRDIASRADSIIAHERIWATYEFRLDAEPRRDRARDGDELPFQIFITNDLPEDLTGATGEYCGPPVADAVLVQPTARHLKAVLAHELFHAFARGIANRRFPGWWAEATAQWAEMQFIRDPDFDDYLDEHFLQQPELQLDAPRAVSEQHQYGAWRLIEWLEPYVDVWGFMVDTFERIGRGTSDTGAVRAALHVRGRALGEDLGEFWGAHLRPESPLNGPATRGERVEFPRDEPTGDDYFVEDRQLRAQRLAADVSRLRLARDSNVQSITIRVDPAPPGTHLWVQNGNDLDDWTGGGSTRFCVGGFSRTTDAKAWPGQFPLAYTNGHSTGSAISQGVQIKFRAEECDGFVRDPSAAVDESPSLELPDSCPATPVYFRPPHGHTDYFVLRERINRVYESQVDWQHAALRRVQERGLSQRRAGRLFARWLYCSARRARDIDHIPDDLIRDWRGDFVRLTRRAARKYEHGLLYDAIEPLQRAGAKYGQITTRATVQDIETAP